MQVLVVVLNSGNTAVKLRMGYLMQLKSPQLSLPRAVTLPGSAARLLRSEMQHHRVLHRLRRGMQVRCKPVSIGSLRFVIEGLLTRMHSASLLPLSFLCSPQAAC